MRAVVFDRFGEPAEVLGVREVDDPSPGPNEVLVRMLASPVNPSDLMTVRGVYPRKPELPATPGYEGVGVVEGAGSGILGGFLKGKRVAAMNPTGGNWAERVVIPAKQAIPLAKELTLEQAATFFVNPATAYVMTRKVLAVPQGDWLLQTAAGSALGRMVIRLGREFGFRTLNVVRRSEQAEELRQLGADHVAVFDGATGDADAFVDEVKSVTDGGVRCAIDPVGGPTGSAVARCLGPGGRMLVYGTLDEAPLEFSPRVLMTPGAAVEGFWLSNWMQSRGLLGKLSLVRTITKLIRAGVLESDVGKVFPLEEVAEAVRQSERSGRGGKVLLRIGDEGTGG